MEHSLITQASRLFGQRQYAQAIVLLDQATRLAPDNFYAWHCLTLAHIALQQWEPSLHASDHALAHSANGYARATSLHLKASALMILERYEEALAIYDDMLTIDTIEAGKHPILQAGLKRTHAMAWTGKGAALDKLGRYDEALAAYDHALTMYPNISVYLANDANALRDLHRYEEALVLYDRILAQSPQNAQVWREKATTLRAAGRDDEADAAEEHLNELGG